MQQQTHTSKSSLKGKVAVVTGSTQGLGEATVRLFKERGCRGLVISGRNEKRGQELAKELTSTSCTAIFVKADLENLDECRNIISVADETFGSLDILVNAAATTDRGSIWDTTPEDYDRIMSVNTKAPFFLMQDAARIMEREHIEGSIINISSTASYGSMPMIAAYGMSKGALNVATKNFAYSLMWSRIRVNALAIGQMDTPGEDEIQRRLHCNSDSDKQNWKESAELNQPFGRLLKTDEVARCIAFCASEESGMMTGCVIDFDQSVFGAGNSPVPPPKEQWPRANGMTFTFDEKKDSKAQSAPSTPTSTSKTTKSKPASTPVSKSKPAAASTPPSASAAGNRSPGGTRWPPSPAEKESKTTAIPPRVNDKNATPTSGELAKDPENIINPSIEHITELCTSITSELQESRSAANDKKKILSNKEVVKNEEENKGKQDRSKPSATMSHIDEPYPDEDRPDPSEFLAMRKMQREGKFDVNRPDDYLPGTDPFAGAKMEKDRAKKQYSSNSDNCGKSKVDDWLGSDKPQKRTWKVKEEKPSSPSS